jgi:hypothetical protein
VEPKFRLQDIITEKGGASTKNRWGCFTKDLDDKARAMWLRRWYVSYLLPGEWSILPLVILFSGQRILSMIHSVPHSSYTWCVIGNSITEDDDMAIDDGGPTRDFLSNVWTQIGDLHVTHPRDSETVAKLFDRDAHAEYIVPQTNVRIASALGLNISDDGTTIIDEDSKFALELIKPFGRAIGRIMLYCIANQLEGDDDDDTRPPQRFYIATHILHNLFRNYLFRGVDPKHDDEYPLLELLVDVVDLKFTEATKKGNNAQQQMQLYLDDERHGTDLECSFRQMASQDFITGRSWILDSIKEGLTLDGMYSSAAVRSGPFLKSISTKSLCAFLRMSRSP